MKVVAAPAPFKGALGPAAAAAAIAAGKVSVKRLLDAPEPVRDGAVNGAVHDPLALRSRRMRRHRRRRSAPQRRAQRRSQQAHRRAVAAAAAAERARCAVMRLEVKR